MHSVLVHVDTLRVNVRRLNVDEWCVSCGNGDTDHGIRRDAGKECSTKHDRTCGGTCRVEPADGTHSPQGKS